MQKHKHSKPNTNLRELERKVNKIISHKSEVENVNVVRNAVGTKQSKGFDAKKITLRETEYIGNITSNGSDFNLFSITGDRIKSQQLNPGNAALFPWGSTHAKLYEQYVWKKLKFQYKPLVTEYQPPGLGVGKIIFNVDYDAADQPPANQQQMEDSQPRVDARPVEYMELICDPKQMHKDSDGKFVLFGDQPAFTDIKTYSTGQLFIATAGQTSGGVIGELYVDYEVELLVPVLTLGRNIRTTNELGCVTASALDLPSNVSIMLPYTSVAGTVIPTPALGQLKLAPGQYLVTSALHGLLANMGSIDKMSVGISLDGIIKNIGDYYVPQPDYTLDYLRALTVNGTQFLTVPTGSDGIVTFLIDALAHARNISPVYIAQNFASLFHEIDIMKL